MRATDIRQVSVRSADDVGRAANALMQLARELGPFQPIVSHNIASRQPMVDEDGVPLAVRAFGFADRADGWWRDGRLALASPVAQACRYESDIFWVDADGFRTRTPNDYLGRIDLANFASRARLTAGIVVPVHLAYGQIGMAIFTTDAPAAEIAQRFASVADDLLIIARRFVASYASFARRARGETARALTERETECLHWAALGKTDIEIACLLDRSLSTVRFHLMNARDKLGAVSRAQTLFKATQLGYIAHPEPVRPIGRPSGAHELEPRD